MQWLIDLVIEYLHIHGLAVYRGNIAAVDFAIGDFTLDGAWHTLDLSSIVPANATVVHLLVSFKSSVTNDSFWIGRAPQAGNPNRSIVRTAGAFITVSPDITCYPDANRHLEYTGSVSTTVLNMVVKGWDF